MHTKSGVVERATGFNCYIDDDFLQQRIGTVLMRSDEDSTVFTSVDADVAHVVPAKPVFDPYTDVWRKLDGHSYDDTLEPSDRQRRRQKLAMTALLMSGVGAVELTTTGDLMHDAIGAATGLAVSALYGLAHRQKRINRAAGYLDAIDDAFASPEKCIALPNKAMPVCIPIEELGKRMVQACYDGRTIEQSAINILNRADTQIPDRSFIHLPSYPELDKQTNKVIIATDTTLFEEYYKSVSPDLFNWLVNEVLDKSSVDRYKEFAAKFAKRNGIVVGTSENNVTNRAGKPVPDAKIGLVSLPPAQVVQYLLVGAKNPEQLWHAIEPVLVEYMSAQEGYKQKAEDLKRVQKLINHVCESSSELRSEKAALKQELYVLSLEDIGRMLQILLISQHMSNMDDYVASRDALIDSIKDTASAEEQGKAIQLVNTAFEHFMKHLPPDDEESVKVAKRLTKYLVESMEFLTMGSDNHVHIYNGMRAKFPQLQLPGLGQD